MVLSFIFENLNFYPQTVAVPTFELAMLIVATCKLAHLERRSLTWKCQKHVTSAELVQNGVATVAGKLETGDAKPNAIIQLHEMHLAMFVA